MTEGVARRVRRGARHRCEYCRLPSSAARFRHQIDHIIAEQHGGDDDPSNLALAGVHRNLHKGPNIARLDPSTGGLSRLFHPRRDRWGHHFARRGAWLDGLTPIGRATIKVPAINDPIMIETREALIGEERFPPE